LWLLALAEDDGLAAVHQDAMLKMRTNSASKHDCFKVATFTGEVGD
jgi:hypothetical protein